ncbi:sulfotransferase domain-containing protein [Sulfuricystis thermophila]|uniref:sulfotransferase domain-containing protein n=1 Tax=Sulfuricystis thermophila TaxID=2496847 RepID=UPI0010359D87|nr:sulfotransferase domain-containing protein [Sulfuricystis thermophila]
MKKPNFFIIGAPKCGTTSWASWLASHPQVFMSPMKEPQHFSADLRVLIPRRADYERLFRNATDRHRAVGEASATYLFSEAAVPHIERYVDHPKYIICLRNPVEMAYSLHEQMVVSGMEDVLEFERAWVLSEARFRGEQVSRWCDAPKILAYGRMCKLGEQLLRLYRTVPKDRVHTILLDDVRRDARAEYLKVLAFLGLDDDGRCEFPVENPAKTLRSFALNRTVQALARFKYRLRIYHIGLGILDAIAKKNMKYRPRVPMRPDTRRELEEFFREDIKLLEELLERRLGWISGS